MIGRQISFSFKSRLVYLTTSTIHESFKSSSSSFRVVTNLKTFSHFHIFVPITSESLLMHTSISTFNFFVNYFWHITHISVFSQFTKLQMFSAADAGRSFRTKNKKTDKNENIVVVEWQMESKNWKCQFENFNRQKAKHISSFFHHSEQFQSKRNLLQKWLKLFCRKAIVCAPHNHSSYIIQRTHIVHW